MQGYTKPVDLTPNVQSMKENIVKWDIIKIKKLFSVKDPLKE